MSILSIMQESNLVIPTAMKLRIGPTSGVEVGVKVPWNSLMLDSCMESVMWGVITLPSTGLLGSI